MKIFLQEPIRSAFCNSDEGVKEAYSDLIDSTKKTLDSILKLQEVGNLEKLFIFFSGLFILHELFCCSKCLLMITSVNRHLLRRIR